MPPRDPRALLSDIADACNHIREIAADKVLDDYSTDWKFRAIAERQFITIGEALRSLLDLDPTMESSITHARLIIDFRNMLVHGYSLVDHATVWSVIESNVPKLAEEVEQLMQKSQDDAS